MLGADGSRVDPTERALSFLFDRALYGEICRAAYASTREFLEEHFPHLEGAVPAMVVSPQSHGSLLNFHPHWHAVVSRGLFDREGRFHEAPEDLDFSPLGDLFRERTFQALLKAEATNEERVQMLRSWKNSGFRVDASRRLGAEDRAGLETLLVYMERGPVALERLRYQREEGLVYYRGKFHPSLGRDHQLLGPVDFLALLVPHVLLRFQSVIRCYGALSTTVRRRLGWIQKPAGGARGSPGAPAVVVVEGEESDFVRLRRRSWARLIARVWLEDPSLCPSCGQEMKILAAITSPAQDDVIERILRARGQWDPPWLKSPPARGPPRSRASLPSSRASLPGEDGGPIDAGPPDEAYLQDPERPEDTWA